MAFFRRGVSCLFAPRVTRVISRPMSSSTTPWFQPNEMDVLIEIFKKKPVRTTIKATMEVVSFELHYQDDN